METTVRLIDRLKQWTLAQLEHRHVGSWLAALSFAESSFFPIPPDFFMLPVIVRRPERWVMFAFIITLASVLGGIFGYVIGMFFYEVVGIPLVKLYHLEEALAYVREKFNENAFWAVFTAAFTPIPYKLFTIASGLFSVDLPIFLIASIMGRGLRFFAVAYIARVFGKRLGVLIFRYFNTFTLLIAIVVLVFVLLQFVR